MEWRCGTAWSLKKLLYSLITPDFISFLFILNTLDQAFCELELLEFWGNNNNNNTVQAYIVCSDI